VTAIELETLAIQMVSWKPTVGAPAARLFCLQNLQDPGCQYRCLD
jgi:hypothetical protein